MLQVENLTKSFPNVLAVDDLSFHLEEGRICGFVGPNGAGKTTTMRIIATLEEPTRGKVSVDGMSLFSEPYRVRRRIGFMPDHYGVYPAMTCRDYLEFYARAYEVEAKLRTSRINGIMDFTGLDKISDKQVESLSKGMKQRLNLGRALINDPKLMIMDEPAAGLDPRARVELRYLVKSLSERGKTIFISSHILTELAEICDSILVIDKGKRITFGAFEEIQKSLQEVVSISVRLLKGEEAPNLEFFLMERANVADIRLGENGRVQFNLTGDISAAPHLIRDMLNAEFSVIEFKQNALTMEDVFLKITEGTF